MSIPCNFLIHNYCIQISLLAISWWIPPFSLLHCFWCWFQNLGLDVWTQLTNQRTYQTCIDTIFLIICYSWNNGTTESREKTICFLKKYINSLSNVIYENTILVKIKNIEATIYNMIKILKCTHTSFTVNFINNCISKHAWCNDHLSKLYKK